MKKIFAALSLLTLVLFSSGSFANEGLGEGPHQHEKLCPLFFKAANVCAQVEFTKGPYDGAESQFLVQFFDHKSAHGEHVMVDPTDLKIDLWMFMGDHGGHGSAPVKVVKQATGVYYVSEVYFVMPGRWTVRFFANGEQANLTVDVNP